MTTERRKKMKTRLRQEYYNKAGNDGDANAQYRLARSYAKLASDWQPMLVAMLDLFTSAAAKGHLKSQRKLGFIYAKNIKRTIPTVPVDIPGKDIAISKLPWAIYHYRQGANQGDQKCWMNLLLVSLKYHSIDDKLSKHDVEAVKYHARCSALHPSDRFDLGRQLRDLLHEDCPDKKKIMKIIADMAHELTDELSAEAQHEKGLFLYESKTSDRRGEGFMLMERAAFRGYGPALSYLGQTYWLDYKRILGILGEPLGEWFNKTISREERAAVYLEKAATLLVLAGRQGEDSVAMALFHIDCEYDGVGPIRYLEKNNIYVKADDFIKNSPLYEEVIHTPPAEKPLKIFTEDDLKISRLNDAYWKAGIKR